MLQRAGIPPIAVGDDDELRLGVFPLHIPQGGFIGLGIGIAQESEGFILRPLDQAAAIEDFFGGEPDHDIVHGVALAREIGFEGELPHGEYRVSRHQEFGALFLVGLAELVGEDGGKGSDALFAVIFQAVGFVAVPVCGECHYHIGLMSLLDAVQQGLELRGIPRRIEHHHARIGHHIHAVGRDLVAVIGIVGGVDIEVVGERGDLEGLGKEV